MWQPQAESVLESRQLLFLTYLHVSRLFVQLNVRGNRIAVLGKKKIKSDKKRGKKQRQVVFLFRSVQNFNILDKFKFSKILLVSLFGASWKYLKTQRYLCGKKPKEIIFLLPSHSLHAGYQLTYFATKGMGYIISVIRHVKCLALLLSYSSITRSPSTLLFAVWEQFDECMYVQLWVIAFRMFALLKIPKPHFPEVWGFFLRNSSTAFWSRSKST